MAPKKRKAADSDDNNASSGDEKSASSASSSSSSSSSAAAIAAREVENATAEDGSCSAETVNDSRDVTTTVVNKDGDDDQELSNSSAVTTGSGVVDNGGAPPEDSSASANAVSELQQQQQESDGSSSNKPEKKRFHLSGSEKTGTLLICGGTNWDLIGRRELPKGAKGAGGRNLWGPHRMAAMKGVRVKAVVSGSAACHNILITEEGKVMSYGRNDKGQLGHCDLKRRDAPELIETLKSHTFVSAACGRSHTLFLSDKGVVYACGDNKMGQCGIGSQNQAINIPTRISFQGRPIVKVAAGSEFSMIVDVRGGLYSFGCPEYGQLGHNSDGRYFVTSNKLQYQCELMPRRVALFIEKNRDGHVMPVDDVHVVDVACGLNHTLVMDTKKRCFSWGFGGYGRLGHNEPKDEMVPRIIKSFEGPNRGVKAVYAGGTYSLAVGEYGVLYFWGQNKTAGEATMYPKPVHDLTGWTVRDIGCANRSIVVLADESVVSWGPSPTYGELGYGDNRPKSSTTPQEVKPLDKIHIHKVACGYGHTMFIAKDDTEEDRERLNKLPEYSP